MGEELEVSIPRISKYLLSFFSFWPLLLILFNIHKSFFMNFFLLSKERRPGQDVQRWFGYEFIRWLSAYTYIKKGRGRTELRSCVKVEVSVLGSPSLIVLMTSVDVRQHWTRTHIRAQQLCETRGGRPGIPVPNSPYGFCGRKANFNLNSQQSTGAVWKSRWTSWAPRP